MGYTTDPYYYSRKMNELSSTLRSFHQVKQQREQNKRERLVRAGQEALKAVADGENPARMESIFQELETVDPQMAMAMRAGASKAYEDWQMEDEARRSAREGRKQWEDLKGKAQREFEVRNRGLSMFGMDPISGTAAMRNVLSRSGPEATLGAFYGMRQQGLTPREAGVPTAFDPYEDLTAGVKGKLALETGELPESMRETVDIAADVRPTPAEKDRLEYQNRHLDYLERKEDRMVKLASGQITAKEWSEDYLDSKFMKESDYQVTGAVARRMGQVSIRAFDVLPEHAAASVANRIELLPEEIAEKNDKADRDTSFKMNQQLLDELKLIEKDLERGDSFDPSRGQTPGVTAPNVSDPFWREFGGGPLEPGALKKLRAIYEENLRRGYSPDEALKLIRDHYGL